MRLRRALRRGEHQHDITVIVPVRNRMGPAIENTLRAVRGQSYPSELVRLVIVDYNSDAPYADWLATIAAKHHAALIRVADVSEWNKSHCLNIAIRRCTTRYLMVLDADVLLASNYLQRAIDELARDPLQVVMSQILDLPETERDFPPEFDDADLVSARQRAAARTSGLHHEGTIITATEVLKRLRGYDENFRIWGAEDNDMVRRLEHYAMDLTSVASTSFYLHQWHPKYEGADPDVIERQFQANWAYLKRTQRTLVRNRQEWGGEKAAVIPSAGTLVG
jgi:glycosyltransferase involved in cell wall biosynthesis